MTGMTGAAASRAAVRIDSANAGVGPRRRVKLAVGQNLDGRTVALRATAGGPPSTAWIIMSYRKNNKCVLPE
jgi:hypothetical protein